MDYCPISFCTHCYLHWQLNIEYIRSCISIFDLNLSTTAVHSIPVEFWLRPQFLKQRWYPAPSFFLAAVWQIIQNLFFTLRQSTFLVWYPTMVLYIRQRLVITSVVRFFHPAAICDNCNTYTVYYSLEVHRLLLWLALFVTSLHLLSSQ